MSTPKIIINNGKRIQVSLPDFEGLAGFVEAPSGITMAYMPNKKGSLAVGETVEADNEQFTVLRIDASQLVEGFRVLTLARPQG